MPPNTVQIERALSAASGIAHQAILLRIAAPAGSPPADDYFYVARATVAEYLRHTGRPDEALQVEAIAGNEWPAFGVAERPAS